MSRSIPKLRFPEFSEEWEVKKLGEVTMLFSRRNKEKLSGPIYSVTNSRGFVLQTEHFSKSVAGNDLAAYKIVQKGDFAYNPARINVGSIARLSDSEAVISSLYVCFRPKLNTNGEFLDQFLHKDSTMYYYSVLGEGGVRIYLWYPLFSRIKISLPRIVEQEKIAGFLTAVDELIAVIDKKVELMQRYKKGVMQKIFTQKLRFKDEDGEDYSAWQSKRFGEIIEDIGDGGTPDTSNQNNFGGEISWAVIDDIRDEITYTKNTLSEQGLKRSSAKLWPINTIILSTGATIGEVGIAKIPMATKQGIAGIKLSVDQADGLFIKYWLRNSKKTLLRYAQGSSIKEIRPPEIRKLPIHTPVLEEQRKIADFLMNLDDKINLEKTKLEQVKLFKKSLLQRMFA
ncbi:MAG TPA: restriction endonuclease subunit S [Candidatus Saccharibacteria bacterium]|nr:restriction endonuclease subunit S [Candidatus Saccharibacteria bacterium]